MTTRRLNDIRKRNEFVDHSMFDLCDLLTTMGIKKPRVDIELSEWQCAVFIDYIGNCNQQEIADKIKKFVKTDLKLYGIEDAENITVTVFENGK